MKIYLFKVIWRLGDFSQYSFYFHETYLKERKGSILSKGNIFMLRVPKNRTYIDDPLTVQIYTER